MLKKILIANRGEIACRIIRTARKLGVATVAVYSDADAKALHVAQADEAVHIGPSPATDSYLRGEKIIAAAKATGAEAIHPGYGFLSENADFADDVAKAGLKFIGPSASAMRALGGKAAAKEIAIKAGVPVVPGYQGDKQDAKTLAAESKKIGYPIMIKAVAGGGGRGMRLVEKEADLPELLASAQREAASAFGNPLVLIEKVVVRPRHIEVQVFGDSHGNVVHIFERDCTLQRRNQKVVEEAPAPGMSAELREKMCAAAVELAKHVGYEGAGTVEFLVEGGPASLAPSDAHPQPALLGADAKWYFIEMNTRLQVEHPVTEEITGLDLVEWQLRVASGEKLPLPQDKITMSGHAIEVRLCAEDPAKGFLPSIGKITNFDYMMVEEDTRIEHGVEAGDSVSPFYDSMIAKVIVKANDRAKAIDQMLSDLGSFYVSGIRTNASFLVNLLSVPAVKSGDMDTGLIAREMEPLSDERISRTLFERALGEAFHNRGFAGGQRPNHYVAQTMGHNPWSHNDVFRLGQSEPQTLDLVLEGHPRRLRLQWIAKRSQLHTRMVPKLIDGGGLEMLDQDEDESAFISRNGDGPVTAFERGRRLEIAWPTYDASQVDDGADGSAVRAPINGKVARIFVAEGDAVEKGTRIAVVEAMKMEHVLTASKSGSVAKVAAREGQQVTQGTVLVTLAE
ncbi:MAG: acetyl/propionyl/methylcrotonyl-CoA carboxylase subunit alpha [Hyphomicrobiaceae bacterium]